MKVPCPRAEKKLENFKNSDFIRKEEEKNKVTITIILFVCGIKICSVYYVKKIFVNDYSEKSFMSRNGFHVTLMMGCEPCQLVSG